MLVVNACYVVSVLWKVVSVSDWSGALKFCKLGIESVKIASMKAASALRADSYHASEWRQNP